MNSKILVAAGTALAVGALTIAVPVFAQTDNADATNSTQATEQLGRFGKFGENMHEGMNRRTPPTFDEAKAKMTENLTKAQTQSAKMLEDLKSGALETRLDERLDAVKTYLEKVQNATGEEELQAVREEMRTQIQDLKDSRELPLGLGMGIGAPGKGRGMHGFEDMQDAPDDDETSDTTGGN